jgi:hypothetical protein
MDLKLLQELKGKLLHDKMLAPVWEYFFDHFAEDSEFIALGERATHQLVETIVAEVGKQMFGREGVVNSLLLTRVPDQQFLHGCLIIGGRVGGVIYFEDAQIGLVAMADKPPSIEVKYARFSGQMIRRPAQPSRN